VKGVESTVLRKSLEELCTIQFPNSTKKLGNDAELIRNLPLGNRLIRAIAPGKWIQLKRRFRLVVSHRMVMESIGIIAPSDIDQGAEDTPGGVVNG
jgi:hypothetical protein